MADLEMGNVEAYVKELVAEYFDSETERHSYSNKGGLASNIYDDPVSTHGSLFNNAGQSGDTKQLE